MSHVTSPTLFSEPPEPDYQSGVAAPSNYPPPRLSHRFRFGSPPSYSHPPSDPSWYHSPFPHSFFPPPRYPSYTPLPLHLPQSTSTDHQLSTIQPSHRIHQANPAATEVGSLRPTPVNGPDTSHNIEDILPPYYLPAMSSLTQLVNGHRTASTRYPVPIIATHEGPGTGSSGVFHHPSRAASSSETVEQHQRSAAGRGKKGSVGQVNHTRKGKKRALTPLESVQGSSGGASEVCGRPEGAGTSRSLQPCNPLSSKMPGGNEVEPATSCAPANRPSNSTIREPRVRKGASKLHSWAESDPEVVDWAPAPAIKEKKADHDFRVPGQELRGGPHKSAFRYIVPFESHGAGSDAASNRRARATAFLAKFRGSPFVCPSSETAVSNQIAQSMSEVADSTNQAALSDPSSEHLGNSVSSSTDSSQSDSNSGRVCVSVRVPFGSRTRPDPSQPGSGTESSRSDRRQSKRSLRLDRRHIHSATTDAPFVLGDVPVRSKRMRIEPQPLAATRHSSSGSQGVSEPTRTQGMLETQGGQEMDRVQTAEETYTAPHANQSQDVNRRGNFQEEMTNGSQQMIESQSQGRDSINPNSSPDVTTSLSSDSLHAVPLTVPTQPTTTAGGFQLVPTMSSSHAFSLSLEISGGSGGNTIDLSLDVSGMEGPSTVPPHHHNTPPALPIPSTSIPSASPSFPMLTHLPSLPSLHHPAEPGTSAGTSGLGGSQEEIIIVDSSDDEDDHNVIMFTRSSPSQQYYGNRHFLRRGQRKTSQIARDEEIARRLQAQFDQEMDPPHPPPHPRRPHTPPPPPYSAPALADVPRSSSETPNLPSLPPPPPLPPAPPLPPPRAPGPARRAVERRGSNRRSSRGSIRLPPYVPTTSAQSYYGGGSRYPNIFGLESYYGGISIPYHPNILSPEDHFRSHQIYHNYPVPESSHFPPDPHHLLHAAASFGHSSVGRNQFNPSVVFNALLGQGANSYEDLLELADRLGPAHARRLSKEEIKALPLRKYKKDGDDKSCVVCMSEFQSKEKIRSLPPCDHDFHQKCIDKWLKDHNTCPICRVTIAVVTPSTT